MVALMRERVGEVAPFTVMMITEGCTIALTILAKTAITGGMSPFPFVVYTNAIGSLLLLPLSFLFHRESTEQSLFTFPLLVRIFFLGLTGIAISQNLAFVGLSYSSPIVVCATGLLIPSFSFLLSITFRCWILGGILLGAASLSNSIWNIIQLGTVKQYPQVMKVASFYSLAGTIQCLVFSLFMERDLNAWKLKHNLELLLTVVTGVFGSIIRSNVHLACARMKGPFYVPMFKPFGIVFATIFGVSFFTNSLHYGSVIGIFIIGMGYYAVMWGQIREGELRKECDDVGRMDGNSDLKTPLLLEQEEALV